MKSEKGCALCGRSKPLTDHHLIPRTCHSNKWFKKNFTMQEMRLNQIPLCRKCHKFIHTRFTEKELGREYNTRDKLLAHEDVKKFLIWVRKQK